MRAGFWDGQRVAEVTSTELARRAGAVLDRVARGERLIVTRNRRAVAVIVALQDGVEVMLAGSERFALLRQEAREDLEAGLTEAVTTWRSSGSRSF